MVLSHNSTSSTLKYKVKKFLPPFSLFLFLSIWLTNSFISVRFPDSERPLEIYSNQTQDDLKRIYKSAIERADHSILLFIYSLTDPSIIQALKEKSRSISVTVICDAKACPNLEKRLGKKITLIKRQPKGLMHQKILVIDKKYVWVGSANMTNESLRMNGNLVFGLESQKMAHLIETRAKEIIEQGRLGKIELTPIPAKNFLIGNQKVEFWFLPDNKQAVKRITDLIDSAKKTVKVAMFTWTHPTLTQSIIQAHLRGVKVEAVIDYQSSLGSSQRVFQRLMENQVPTSRSSGRHLLHYKFAYIDDSLLINGSANWTKAAFTQNEDCFMIVHDLLPHQKKHIERLWTVICLEALSPIESLLPAA